MTLTSPAPDAGSPVARDRAASGRSDPDRVVLGGSRVELATESGAVETILAAARNPGIAPLGVVSANLDHVHHFGGGSRWHGVLEQAEAMGQISWLTLLDGAPLVSQTLRLTGRAWPRLAGSDIIDRILRGAVTDRLSVGFVGGSPETHALLRDRLRETHPGLTLAGCWSPAREDLADPEKAGRIADEIRATGVEILAVCLGKPRQELWMAEHGARTGAPVLLAFGAVVDFLAGRVSRAPEWAARNGLEWSYRLAREPRRLYRRYLVDGPEAYMRLRQRSRLEPPCPPQPGEVADLTIVLTGSSGDPGASRVEELRRAVEPLTARVTPLRGAPAPAALATSLKTSGPSRAVLVLRSDADLQQGALPVLWQRLWQDGVGAVVPATRDRAGETVRTLRFVPTRARRLGDLVWRNRFPGRPCWLTGVDRDAESYVHPHPVQGAVDDCVLVRAEVARRPAVAAPRTATDLVSAARSAGWMAWYEPAATVRVPVSHAGHGRTVRRRSS